MQLKRALRLSQESITAFVGAGGKSSLMFQLCAEYSGRLLLFTNRSSTYRPRDFAVKHLSITNCAELKRCLDNSFDGPLLITNKPGQNVDAGVEPNMHLLEYIAQYAIDQKIPLLIESDWANNWKIKAPSSEKRIIPSFLSELVTVCGMNALLEPLYETDDQNLEVFSRKSGLEIGASTFNDYPDKIRRVAVLNQADNDYLLSAAGRLAQLLQFNYSSIVSTSFHDLPGKAIACYEKISGIILAGGQSKRLGWNKAGLLFRGVPFIRVVAETALNSGLEPVVVVLGANAEENLAALGGLPVEIVNNPIWENGQSTSIIAGIRRLPSDVGGTIFLLVDQPQLTQRLIRSLIELHSLTLAPIVAPMVDGQRGNPVLFDRDVFQDLLEISGDVGGRAIFHKHPIQWLNWLDSTSLIDIDTNSDYDRLRRLCE